MSNEKNTAMVRASAGFEPANLQEATALAKMLSESSLIPNALRNKPGDVFVILVSGHEMGLSPMQAMRGMHVIQGRPVVSADLMVALATRRPDVCRYFRLVTGDATQAIYETHRVGHPEPTRMKFTLDEAKAAKLTGKDTWAQYPAAMLRARCSSALARAVYPDLLFGVYENDEGDDLRKGDRPRAEARRQAIDAQVIEMPAQPAPREDAAPEVVADAPAADPVPDIAARMAAAASIDELQAIANAVPSLPPDKRLELREAYTAAKKRLATVAA